MNEIMTGLGAITIVGVGIFLFILTVLTIILPFIIFSIRNQVIAIRESVSSIENELNKGLKIEALPEVMKAPSSPEAQTKSNAQTE